jgi:outer membrane biogenesis lipoprotein LolB
MMRFLSLLMACLLVTACAHKGQLKTPSQIVIDQKKKEARAIKNAERAEKRAADEAKRKAEEEKDSQEVTVP